MIDGAIDRLKEMVNKPFLYQNEEVVILNYCDGTGDDGTEVEIYLNNGKVLVFSMFDLASKLNRFRPITNTVVVLANERLNKVSTVNPTILRIKAFAFTASGVLSRRPASSFKLAVGYSLSSIASCSLVQVLISISRKRGNR